MLKATQPIGIFDSGIGGLTVANAITRSLPNEEIIYFGDTAHLPYGDKSPESIIHYSEKITEFLIGKGCKIVVIACNTASSVAFDILQEKYGDQILLVSVIDPVVNAIIEQDVKQVGVIGTKGTIKSNIYEKKLKALNPDLEITSLATPLLAPMIEEGFFNSKISQVVINAYLAYPDFNYCGAIILACTHYPLIKNEIEKFYGGNTKVYDSTDTVAKYVQELLKEKGLLSTAKNNPHHFFVSDYTRAFEKTTKYFYKEQIKLEHVHIWQ